MFNEWQPIEAAPKDGTFILLAGGATSEDDYMERGVKTDRPVVAFYDSGDGDVDGGYWWMCFWDGEWRTSYENPTHWMPLPEPPNV